jgi:hypothetical protein
MEIFSLGETPDLPTVAHEASADSGVGWASDDAVVLGEDATGVALIGAGEPFVKVRFKGWKVVAAGYCIGGGIDWMGVEEYCWP